MREDICSIPVNDVFLPKEGCPFCRMRDMLEDRMATYITGAAMMEPDVRIETNRLGFCREHFAQILKRGSRLSVALILESLLAEVQVRNTLKLWQTDPEFRRLYSEQPHLCLPHYGMVLEASQKLLPKKELAAFEAETARLAGAYLKELSGDVTHFCRMFDYRNAGADWGNSKDAIERAIFWLTAREPDVAQKADEKNR